MAARRKLSDADRLAMSIARAIRRSTCSPRDVVSALVAVAAGRAVIGNTHGDCGEFEDEAHAAFHSAATVMSLRQRGDRFVN